MTWPVIIPALSPARKRIASAMSSGRISRPMGISGVGPVIAVGAVFSRFAVIVIPRDLLIHQDELCALPGKGERRRRADPLRIVRARDDRRFVLQTVIQHLYLNL